MHRSIPLGLFLVALAHAQGPTPSADLQRAAAEASLPVLKKLFVDFAVPHDRVLVTGTTETLRVQPLPLLNLGGTRDLTSAVKVLPLDPKAAPLTGAVIHTHHSYEVFALKEVAKFLKEADTVPSAERLAAAERVLAAVAQFHESQRADGVRKGPAWDGLRKELARTLLTYRTEQLDTRTSAGELSLAVALASRLLTAYGTAPDAAAPEGLAAGLARLIDKVEADAKLDEAGKLSLLEQVSRAVRPHRESKLAARAVEKLHALAGVALRQATDANEGTPPKVAVAQAAYTRAERLWPYHEGIGKFALKVQLPNTTLRVGVAKLPGHMSPALARSATERYTLDLLFDSLLHPHRDERGLLTYRPGLAESLPTLVPQGRRFVLSRSATWSDGRALQLSDFQATLGHIAAQTAGPDAWHYGELRALSGGSPRHVDLLFPRIGIDPLSAATFKVVPAHVDATSAAFAKQPVGSGPYTLEGVQQHQGRSTLVFKARTNRAAIRTLHFIESPEPVKDFEQGLIDLALDVQPDQVTTWLTRRAEVAQKARLNLEMPRPTPQTPNRRVYFLTVNRKKPGLDTPAGRLALARSIPREAMLDLLRPQVPGRKLHQPLPGLYPPGTWAFSGDDDKLDLFDPDAASALRKAFATPTTLTVQLPPGNAALAAAFARWQQELKRIPGAENVSVEFAPTGPADLVYEWYDFPDDTFALGPLFARLGVDDAPNDLAQYREFRHLRQRTRELSTWVTNELPVLPLWQLDPLHLVHTTVKAPQLDPQHVFRMVAEWSLNR